MKTTKITALLAALFILGVGNATAGEPPSDRNCIRWMCEQLRFCAGGEQPQVVEKSAATRKDAVKKNGGNDTQGFDISCRLIAWYDYLDCTGEWDGVEKPSGASKKGSVQKVAPSTDAK